MLLPAYVLSIVKLTQDTLIVHQKQKQIEEALMGGEGGREGGREKGREKGREEGRKEGREGR